MSLKFRLRYIYLFFLTLFVIGIVWAQHPEDDPDGDGVTAEGTSGCGLYSLEVTLRDDGKYEMEAIFYHAGFVFDTRRDFPGRPAKWANFKFGAAFYKQAENPIGEHNDNTDVDEDTITAQLKHSWITDDYSISSQEDESHFQITRISYVVDNPSKWWVAGVTYTSYALTEGASGDQMKAVSEFRIPAGESSSRGYYYKETVWGRANSHAGSAVPWPWH